MTGTSSNTPTALSVIGLAALTHGAYAGMDLQPIWDGLMARIRSNPYDAGALMDMSVVLQLTGQKAQGLAAQEHALALHRVYERAGEAGGLRLLAFVMAGDFMANTPLDFLLEGSNASLIELYVGEGEPLPEIPDHDVAFVAVGESDESKAILANLAPTLERWPRPVLNRNAAGISALSRNGVAALFAGSAKVTAPATLRLSRGELERVAAGEAGLDASVNWPLLVRPVGSHAGTDLQKLADVAALGAYLEAVSLSEAYVSSFIEYAGPDGLYRKYRVGLIGGKAYLSHLAISEHWMVHYLNSGMASSQTKRDEEAAAMAGFDEGFGARHKAALDELCQRINLDYFAIDCAETADGKLLLFEADVAMIIHSMDEPDLFPYKIPQMKKLFAAFQGLLDQAAKG
jgi:hypothetical protein